MALPTLTKTWNFDVNQVSYKNGSIQNAYRNIWFKVKSSLKDLGGWSVVASSNGTLAAAGIDYWTSLSSLVWGTNRSWIILQHPQNNSQISIDLILSPGLNSMSAFVSYSRRGFTVSGSWSPNPSNILPIDSGDQVGLNGGYMWGSVDGDDFNSVSHYMYSSDGYCHRFITYVDDVPLLFLSFDTPETDYASQWAPTSPQASSSIILYPTTGSSARTTNILNLTNLYTNTRVLTRIGPVGTTAAQNISLYLSAEGYNSNLLVNGLQIPNDLTGEYPMLETGLVSTSTPYVGKIGRLPDLWFGVPNILGSPSYPADGSAQFVQHGCLITPWNGSVMLTR